jgi:hypothetical protein
VVSPPAPRALGAVDGNGSSQAPGPRRPARIRSRLVAGAIDTAGVAVAVSLVVQPFPPVLPLGVFVLYHWLSTWLVGRSLGKALLGLRVVRLGGRVTWSWALARSAPGYLIFGVIGLGWLTAVWDSHRRVSYDIILGGMVVQDVRSDSHPQGWLDRLLDYADEHRRALEERKRKVGLLLGLWAWLSAPGAWMRRLLALLRGGSGPVSSGDSIATWASGKAALGVSLAASALAVGAVTVVPATAPIGQWLLEDRYWGIGSPNDGSGDAPLQPIVEGANLIHHFEFGDSLGDTLPTGARLIVHPNTASHEFDDGAWRWSATSHPGGGLELLTSELTDPTSYTLEVLIKYEEVGPSWRKILSFLGQKSDRGLYFLDGHLQLYPFAKNADVSYEAETYYNFILSRESTGSVTVYVVEVDRRITKVYEEADDGGETIPQLVDGGYRFLFFVDDDATTTEWTPGGSVRSIRVWNGPISAVRY